MIAAGDRVLLGDKFVVVIRVWSCGTLTVRSAAGGTVDCKRGHVTTLDDAAAKFPAEFGLRATPGERYRIDVGSSFIGEHGTMWLVLVNVADGRYATRDTPAAIKRAMVK